MARLRLEIKGDPGTISARTLLTALENTVKMLDDLDSAISGQPKGTLDWVVSELGSGSLVVTLESRSRIEDRNLGPEVASAYVTGLGRIEREGSSPPYLSDTGMERAKRLLRLIGRDGAVGFVVSDDQSHTEEISARASAAIDQLIRAQRSAFGSVEGKLETVSVHGRTRYIVYHGRTKKAVTCAIERDDLPRAMDLLGHRVNVAGRVHYNAKGEPLRVDDGDIRPLRDSGELPSTSELTGSDPEYTGKLSTAAYLESIRGG